MPSSVSSLTAWNTSSTSIAVTWSKPLEPNGVITRYEIDVVHSGAVKCTRVLNCVDCQRHCPTVLISTVKITNEKDFMKLQFLVFTSYYMYLYFENKSSCVCRVFKLYIDNVVFFIGVNMCVIEQSTSKLFLLKYTMICNSFQFIFLFFLGSIYTE